MTTYKPGYYTGLKIQIRIQELFESLREGVAFSLIFVMCSLKLSLSHAKKFG